MKKEEEEDKLLKVSFKNNLRMIPREIFQSLTERSIILTMVPLSRMKKLFMNTKQWKLALKTNCFFSYEVDIQCPKVYYESKMMLLTMQTKPAS